MVLHQCIFTLKPFLLLLKLSITFYMISWLNCPKLGGLRANDFRCKKHNIFLSDFSIKLGFTVVISRTKTYAITIFCLNYKLELPPCPCSLLFSGQTDNAYDKNGSLPFHSNTELPVLLTDFSGKPATL